MLACHRLVASAAPTVGQGWDPFMSHAQQLDSSEPTLKLKQPSEADPAQQGFNATSHLAQLPSQLQSSTYLVGDESWSNYNDSQLAPLLPREVVWLMELVEQRIHNKSSLPTQLDRAVTLARYTSVVYCDPANILAWNCSR